MATPNQNLPPINFELPNMLDVLPTITPHQVALCFLIKGYLSPGENDPGGSWPQRQALGDALLTAIREADSVREPTIRELATRLQVRFYYAELALFQTAMHRSRLLYSLRHIQCFHPITNLSIL